MHLAITSVSIFVGTVALSACAPQTNSNGRTALGVVRPALVTDSARDFKPLLVNEVAVYPFAANLQSGVNPELGAQLDQALIRALQAYTGLKLVNIEDPQRFAASMKQLPAVSPLARAQALGIAVASQGVLTGEIRRFVESDGGKYGASNSSAVNFTLRLIEPRTGRTLWQASYDRADEPLTQNLFRLPEAVKQGVTFQSSTEMANEGFKEAAQALQKLRDGQ